MILILLNNMPLKIRRKKLFKKILKRLKGFQSGHLKDYLMKVLH